MQSYTLLEITYIDFKLRRYIGAQICSYSLYCPWYGSSKYVTDHFSEHCSQIPNYAAYTAVPMPNSIPNQIPSHSYNGDTTYLEAVSDKSSAVQWSCQTVMRMPGLQRLLPETIAILEVQPQSTIKHIHIFSRLAAASPQGEESTNVLRSAPREVIKTTYTWIEKPHVQVKHPNEIPTRSQWFRDKWLLWISCQRSYNVQKRNNPTGINNHHYHKTSP